MNSPFYTIEYTPELSDCAEKNTSTWSHLKALSCFDYPWQERQPPATQFRAGFDSKYFYFHFFAQDHAIDQKIKKLISEKTLHSDRVELFFSTCDELNPYYTLEMDPLGRILQAKGHFHRDLNFDWKWPDKDLSTHVTLKDNGYELEGAITLQSLKQFNLIQKINDVYLLKTGIFRAHYEQVEHKRRPNWISWIKPTASQPDFHIPSAFGELRFAHKPI
jgi:hypothetical protein